jgi:hypothetical protein
LDSAPVGLFVVTFLDFKPAITAVCIRHELAALVAENVLLVNQEADKSLFADSKLFCGLSEIGKCIP